MANKILVARGTKARLEEIKSTLAANELVYSTDTGELGVKKASGDIEYFMNAANISAIVDALETNKVDNDVFSQYMQLINEGIGNIEQSIGELIEESIEGMVTDVIYQSDTHVITFKRNGMPDIVIDLPIEALADDINNLDTRLDNVESGKQDKLVAGDNITIEDNVISVSGGGGGGGITKNTISIPFTEVFSETSTAIEVTYSYVGDDPVNFTADFSNFALGGDLVLDMGSGAVPPSMVVQAVFGKTTLNYFEIIILFRYIISATLGGVLGVDGGGSNPRNILTKYSADYLGTLPDVFNGINYVNINEADFTVDFMMACQDIDFYNTITGRGSDMSVTVETLGEIMATGLCVLTGVVDGYFSQGWDSLQSGYIMQYSQYIGGMTLKLLPNIKMKPNYNGSMFID